MSWQPIETAPKDGTDVLLSFYPHDKRPEIAGWFHGEWMKYDSGTFSVDPTHWQPLPEPPCEQPS